jgi:hypothetical protein
MADSRFIDSRPAEIGVRKLSTTVLFTPPPQPTNPEAIVKPIQAARANVVSVPRMMPGTTVIDTQEYLIKLLAAQELDVVAVEVRFVREQLEDQVGSAMPAFRTVGTAKIALENPLQAVKAADYLRSLPEFHSMSRIQTCDSPEIHVRVVERVGTTSFLQSCVPD